MDEGFRKDEVCGCKPVFSGEYKLSRAETGTLLKETAGRPGKVRMLVQSGLLVLVSVTGFVSWLLSDAADSMSLTIGVISLVVLAAMWLVPLLYFWIEAGNIESSMPLVNLTIYHDRIVFGGSLLREVVTEECELLKRDDMLIITVGRESVGLPRRVVTEEQWKSLTGLIDPVHKDEESQP